LTGDDEKMKVLRMNWMALCRESLHHMDTLTGLLGSYHIISIIIGLARLAGWTSLTA